MKPRLAWFSLPVLLMAVIWPLNWRLNHPPLSQTDWQLRQVIAGADRVEIRYMSCQKMACSANVLMKKSLVGRPMAHLRDDLRLLDVVGLAPFPTATRSGSLISYDLFFSRQRTSLAHLNVQVGEFTTLSGLRKWGGGARQLNPRFEARLRAELPLVSG